MTIRHILVQHWVGEDKEEHAKGSKAESSEDNIEEGEGYVRNVVKVGDGMKCEDEDELPGSQKGERGNDPKDEGVHHLRQGFLLPRSAAHGEVRNAEHRSGNDRRDMTLHTNRDQHLYIDAAKHELFSDRRNDHVSAELQPRVEPVRERFEERLPGSIALDLFTIELHPEMRHVEECGKVGYMHKHERE